MTIKNIVLLTIDALRADRVGWLGYNRKVTPSLDDVAAHSRAYTTCIAQSSHTRESMPSLFFSAYPRELGAVGPVPDDRPTLVTELSNAGFTTAGFHSNPYLSRAYGFNRGFDVFDDSLPLARNRITTFLHRVINHLRLQPYMKAKNLTNKGLNWLGRTNGERFLWLHYMDPHGPYQPPTEYQQLFRDETIGKREAKRLWRRTVEEPETIDDSDRNQLRDLYDAEIRYLDDNIGRFFNELVNRDLKEETLVIIGADHGDAFGEHGLYGHPRRLYETLIHVPLLVHPPDDIDCIQINQPVENIDIAPTILDAVDRDIPDVFAGKSLSSDDRENQTSDDGYQSTCAFAHAHGEEEMSSRNWYTVRTKQHKLHLHVNDDGTVHARELYDLLTDPNEYNDLSDEREGFLEEIESRLSTHLSSIDEPTDLTSNKVDDVVEDRLRTLGYRE
jgi:arylsulfatase